MSDKTRLARIKQYAQQRETRRFVAEVTRVRTVAQSIQGKMIQAMQGSSDDLEREITEDMQYLVHLVATIALPWED